MIRPVALLLRRLSKVLSNQSRRFCRSTALFASSAFMQSSTMMMSAPKPVIEPCTETALRTPPAVVSISRARLPRSLMRVSGKSFLYHSLSMSVRGWFEWCRARSWL